MPTIQPVEAAPPSPGTSPPAGAVLLPLRRPRDGDHRAVLLASVQLTRGGADSAEGQVAAIGIGMWMALNSWRFTVWSHHLAETSKDSRCVEGDGRSRKAVRGRRARRSAPVASTPCVTIGMYPVRRWRKAEPRRCELARACRPSTALGWPWYYVWVTSQPRSRAPRRRSSPDARAQRQRPPVRRLQQTGHGATSSARSRSASGAVIAVEGRPRPPGRGAGQQQQLVGCGRAGHDELRQERAVEQHCLEPVSPTKEARMKTTRGERRTCGADLGQHRFAGARRGRDAEPDQMRQRRSSAAISEAAQRYITQRRVCGPGRAGAQVRYDDEAAKRVAAHR